MGLFGKKKEEKTLPACACNGNAVEMEAESMENSCCSCSTERAGACCAQTNTDISSVKVLGSDCKSCHELYENVQKAVKNMGNSVEVEIWEDARRSAIGSNNWEWWYFDAIMDDGTSAYCSILCKTNSGCKM